MMRKSYWGEEKSKRQFEEMVRQKRRKKRDRSKKLKGESNVKPKIGERIKGKSADGGAKAEKMNGWAEGRRRKRKGVVKELRSDGVCRCISAGCL